jgi:hypothetical protein
MTTSGAISDPYVAVAMRHLLGFGCIWDDVVDENVVEVTVCEITVNCVWA